MTPNHQLTRGSTSPGLVEQRTVVVLAAGQVVTGTVVAPPSLSVAGVALRAVAVAPTLAVAVGTAPRHSGGKDGRPCHVFSAHRPNVGQSRGEAVCHRSPFRPLPRGTVRPRQLTQIGHTYNATRDKWSSSTPSETCNM